MIKKIFYCLLPFVALQSASLFACTDILVTPKASTDGSMILAHTDDGGIADQRVIYVPARNYKPHSLRPVYPFPSGYPRYVGRSRGPGYNIEGFPPTKPLGFIPQVKHTYAYFDADYAVINEHQLSFAEGTEAAKVSVQPHKGRAILDISALMRIALERCRTSVCAVKTMGNLATKYGYWGDGEAVLIGDTKDAWEFEITGTPSGTSALWVAKKIPHGTVVALANEFRIRTVTPNDPHLLYSKNLFSVTKKAGWWDGKSTFDWLKVVSPGEYGHPYYSLRRIWRLYSRIKPSAHFSPNVTSTYTKQYPFSIVPDKKLSVRDVMRLFRDHYEDTSFSMRKGLAAGPFGYPNRYQGEYDSVEGDITKGIDYQHLEGAWERPISNYDTEYSTVNQSRADLPDAIGGVMWLGENIPYSTVYMPFYVGVFQLPRAVQIADPKKPDRRSAWWAFDFVANWAALNYNAMIQDIQTKQTRLENREFSAQPKLEQRALVLYRKSPPKARHFLTRYGILNAEYVVNSWWHLADHLIVKYNKGYVDGKTEGYPKSWRHAVGYQNGPVRFKTMVTV